MILCVIESFAIGIFFVCFWMHVWRYCNMGICSECYFSVEFEETCSYIDITLYLNQCINCCRSLVFTGISVHSIASTKYLGALKLDWPALSGKKPGSFEVAMLYPWKLQIQEVAGWTAFVVTGSVIERWMFPAIFVSGGFFSVHIFFVLTCFGVGVLTCVSRITNDVKCCWWNRYYYYIVVVVLQFSWDDDFSKSDFADSLYAIASSG